MTQIDLSTLKIMGFLALGLFLRFGPLAGWISRLFSDRILGALTYAEAHAPEESKADSRENERLWKREGEIRWKWVNALVDCLLAATFASLFLPRSSPYHLREEWFGATIAIGFTGLILIVVVGGNIFGGRRGWYRWSFWLSLFLGTGSMFAVSYWTHPRRRGGIELIAILGFVVFFVFFSTLRNIDNASPEPNVGPSADHSSLSRPPSHGV